MSTYVASDQDFVVGCDGVHCDDSHAQIAFYLDEAYLCKKCWGQEMRERRSTRSGSILPFPAVTDDDDTHYAGRTPVRMPRKSRREG